MADQSTNQKIRRRKHNFIKQVFKAPIKFLATARDLYVKSMMLVDNQMGGKHVSDDDVIHCTTGHNVRVLSRSFSTPSSTSDGVWFLKNVVEEKGGSRMRRRSLSVGVERIDEDKVCEFGEEVMVRTSSASSYVRRRIRY